MTDPASAPATSAPLAGAPHRTSAARSRPPGAATVTRLLPRPATPLGPAPTQPASEGALALARSTCQGQAPAGERPDLRLLDGGQARTRAWAVRFFQVLVEVLGGDRSPHQLLRSSSHEVFLDLTRRCELLNRAAGPDQRRRRVRAQVRSVRVCQPSPLVAEVCARVEQGGRSRAVAGRLELVEGRWQCTALEFG